MKNIPSGPFVYPLTDRKMSAEEDITVLVRTLCEAGFKFIQIREKGISTRDFFEIASSAVETANQFNAAIIINDRVDIALYSGAAGVHLGDEEMSVDAARKVLGDDAIIGLSCHSISDVKAALEQPIDYFAVGPVFGTTSKVSKFEKVGLELVRAARQLTDLPMVAIGGIDFDNMNQVFAAGADGVAVISAIMQPGRVSELARRALN